MEWKIHKWKQLYNCCVCWDTFFSVWIVCEGWKMSFFSSLVANVSSGVANLGLNRRFSLSRSDSGEGNSHDASLKTAATPSITVTSSSNLSTQHGEWFFNFAETRALLKMKANLVKWFWNFLKLLGEHFL